MLVVLLFQRKEYIILFLVLLTALPIFFQIHIMDKNFQLKKISFIDTLALNDYFFSKLELYKRKIENNPNSYRQVHALREDRRKYLSNIIDINGYNYADLRIKKELYSNIIKFPKETYLLFIDLLLENTKQPSYFLPLEKFYINVTLRQSSIVRMINILSVLLFIFFFFFRKKSKKCIFINSFLSLVIFTTYLSTGITFWQGDRFFNTYLFQ